MAGLLLLMSWTAHTQNAQSWPLRVAVMNESHALPNFDFLRYSFQPAVMLGTEYTLCRDEKHDWYLTGNIGYYHHRRSQAAVFLNGELGYRQHFGRWDTGLQLGLGYAHTFYPGPIYRYEDGRLRATKDGGSPTIMPSLALHLAFRLHDSPSSPEIQLMMIQAIDIPFNEYNGLHQFVGIGLKTYPFEKNAKRY